MDSRSQTRVWPASKDFGNPTATKPRPNPSRSPGLPFRPVFVSTCGAGKKFSGWTQVDGSRTRVKTCSVTAAGLPPWHVRGSEIRPGGRRVVSLHLTGRDGPGPDGRRRPEITRRSLSSRRRSPRSIRASNFLTRRQARSVRAGEGAPAARARLPEARATSASTAPAL